MSTFRSAVAFPLLWFFCVLAHAQTTDGFLSNLPAEAQGSISRALVQKVPNISWIQLAKLRSSNGESGDYFGSAVAVSGDIAVVGIRYYGRNYVYVFVKPASGWRNLVQTAELTPSDGGDGFGWAVAIDGDTIAVGGSGNYPYGEVYVYVRPRTGWRNMHETARLTTTVEYGY